MPDIVIAISSRFFSLECMYVCQSNPSGQSKIERERKEIKTEKGEVEVIHLDESVYVCAFHISFYSDIRICDTNDAQLCTSDCIIVTSLVRILKHRSHRHQTNLGYIILELLID